MAWTKSQWNAKRGGGKQANTNPTQRYQAKAAGRTLADFKKDLDNFVNIEVAQANINAIRFLALEFYTLVSLKNSQMTHHPKDTGFAQTNWRISAQGIKSDTLGYKIEGAENRHRSQDELEWQLAHIKPYQAVYVYNNVDYVPELDLGSSKAAPFGMVEPALFDLKTKIQASPLFK